MVEIDNQMNTMFKTVINIIENYVHPTLFKMQDKEEGAQENKEEEIDN